MTDPRESDKTDGIDRRTILKGTAAAGIAGAGVAGTASAEEWHKVRFEAAGDPVFRYRVSVNGKLEREANRDGYDEKIDENTAKGAASEGRFDDWVFTGEVTKLELEGPGRVIIDGTVVRDTTNPDLTNKVTVESKGEKVDYEFRVGGRVTKGDEAGGNDAVIDGTKVRGTVGEEVNGTDTVDTYWYSGPIVFDEADGPLTVTLDIDH